MAFEKTVTNTSYEISIPVDDFEVLIDYETECDVESLYIKLEDVYGVANIDYNGHFGSAIFLSVDHSEDNNETWIKIGEMIQNRIDSARSAQKAGVF